SLPFFSPDGVWLGFIQGTKLVKVAVAGGPVTPISTLAGVTYGATWTVGDTVIFASDSGLEDVPAGGGTPRLIVKPDSGEVFHFPDILPGGKAVLFGASGHGSLKLAALIRRTGNVKRLAQQGGYPRYVNAGFVVLSDPSGILSAVPFDADRLEVTGPARPLADQLVGGGDGDVNVGVSRSGDVAYQISPSTGSRLMLVGRQGDMRNAGADSGYYYTPSPAPDGRHVAVLRGTDASFNNRDVWVFDLIQRTQTRVTFDTTAAWPVWSPDGRRIVYTRFTDGNDKFPGQLYSIPADGSGAAQPLLERPGQWKAAGFEPGGRGIVFSGRSTPQSKEEIWRVDLDPGAKPTPVLATGFNNGSPSLSPDGRLLAYAANESGRVEVYVRPYPGPGGRWQVSLDGGSEPIWSPKGGEIYYRNGDVMMSASVRTQPGFEVTGRTKLFTGQYATAGFRDHNYGVAPDGNSFLMLQSVVGAEQALVVTLNWFDQVRARKK
ncbi:MAG: TolB family protein, partial [Gemmatimonadales bacterium]